MEPSGCAWSGNELGGSAKSFLFAFAYPVRKQRGFLGCAKISCHVLWFAAKMIEKVCGDNILSSKNEGGALHSSFTTNNSLRFNVNSAISTQDVFSSVAQLQARSFGNTHINS